MPPGELKEWIEEELKKGYTVEDVREILKGSDWKPDEYEPVLGEIKRGQPDTKNGPIGTKKLIAVAALGIFASLVTLALIFVPSEAKILESHDFQFEDLNQTLNLSPRDWDEITYISNISSQGWKGIGFLFSGPIPKGSTHKGIVLLHPVSKEKPRYILRNVSLPESDSITARALVTNVAGKLSFAGPCKVSDSIAAIVIQRQGGEIDILEQKVARPEDGWQNITADLSSYSGQRITVGVAGYAGGPGGEWCAEWTATDQFSISYSSSLLNL